MTRDEAVAIIKDRLKKTNTTEYDDRIVREMQLVQAQVLEGAMTLPWFLLSEQMTYTTQVGEERIPLPVDPNDTSRVFLREFEEGALWHVEDGLLVYPPLTKDMYDDMVSRYTSEGKPKVYALSGAYFRVRPIPDAAYVLGILVYLRDTKLTADIENRWLRWAPEWFINETLFRMATFHVRDPETAAVARSMADRQKLELFVVDEARKHANFEMQMGDD